MREVKNWVKFFFIKGKYLWLKVILLFALMFSFHGYSSAQKCPKGCQLTSTEGILKRAVECKYKLNEFVLLPYGGYENEYKKLDEYYGEGFKVTGCTCPYEPTICMEGVPLHVTKVVPIGPPPSPFSRIIIDDPSFVTLTAKPATTPGVAFNLEVKANNPRFPVEVSYLILDPDCSPTQPCSGITVHSDGEIPVLPIHGQHFYHTEVGGWAKPEFKPNPQFFPLPHYRTCVLMLARYEKLYVVFLRENDRQLTYKVLKGGNFTKLVVPGLGEVTREGNRFKVFSYGSPIEIGLWAKGKYLHDEVAGWALPEFKQNPKYYEISHYGMFMLMVARYGKMGLIIGNENDGRLGAVVLKDSQLWTTDTCSGLCQVSRPIPLCRVRCQNAIPWVNVKATGRDPVEISHFSFDNTCWQWEVNGWARPEFKPNPQTFDLKHYTPGFLMVSRYGKVCIYFYNENDGQVGVIKIK